jgi:hypothetical protein
MMCLPKSDDYTRRSETDRFLSANESEEAEPILLAQRCSKCSP